MSSRRLEYKSLKQLSKTDRDLLLIAQTGVINYDQLWMTGFHGQSRESYRIAVKELKKQGFIETFFFQNRRIAVVLTAKGKEYVKNCFDKEELNRIARQMEKPLPSRTSPQFLHRMNTNTFYCSYLSACDGGIAAWRLEYPYENDLPVYGEGANRSDGYLELSGGMKYFVEQDNQTQRSSAINEKINKYITAGIFSSFLELERNVLVFCVDSKLSVQKKENLRKKDSMHIYRISLKILKLWKLLEHIRNEKLYLTDILNIMRTREEKTPIECLFTNKECDEAIRFLSGFDERKGTDMLSFEKFKDSSRRIGIEGMEKKKALDSAFEKRYKDLYLSLTDIPENKVLREQFIKGMRIYLLPLHDITIQQPHLLLREFRMEKEYLKCLACMGINPIDIEPKFKLLYKLEDMKDEIWFRNVFVWPHLLAVWEDIGADIGGYYRVSRFLKLCRSMNITNPLLFVLLVRGEKEASDFYEIFEKEIAWTGKGKIVITFLSKNKMFFQNLMLSPYGVRKKDGKFEFKTVFLEEADGRLMELWEDDL